MGGKQPEAKQRGEQELSEAEVDDQTKNQTEETMRF